MNKFKVLKFRELPDPNNIQDNATLLMEDSDRQKKLQESENTEVRLADRDMDTDIDPQPLTFRFLQESSGLMEDLIKQDPFNQLKDTGLRYVARGDGGSMQFISRRILTVRTSIKIVSSEATEEKVKTSTIGNSIPGNDAEVRKRVLLSETFRSSYPRSNVNMSPIQSASNIPGSHTTVRKAVLQQPTYMKERQGRVNFRPGPGSRLGSKNSLPREYFVCPRCPKKRYQSLHAYKLHLAVCCPNQAPENLPLTKAEQKRKKSILSQIPVCNESKKNTVKNGYTELFKCPACASFYKEVCRRGKNRQRMNVSFTGNVGCEVKSRLCAGCVYENPKEDFTSAATAPSINKNALLRDSTTKPGGRQTEPALKKAKVDPNKSATSKNLVKCQNNIPQKLVEKVRDLSKSPVIPLLPQLCQEGAVVVQVPEDAVISKNAVINLTIGNPMRGALIVDPSIDLVEDDPTPGQSENAPIVQVPAHVTFGKRVPMVGYFIISGMPENGEKYPGHRFLENWRPALNNDWYENICKEPVKFLARYPDETPEENLAFVLETMELKDGFSWLFGVRDKVYEDFEKAVKLVNCKNYSKGGKEAGSCVEDGAFGDYFLPGAQAVVFDDIPSSDDTVIEEAICEVDQVAVSSVTESEVIPEEPASLKGDTTDFENCDSDTLGVQEETNGYEQKTKDVTYQNEFQQASFGQNVYDLNFSSPCNQEIQLEAINRSQTWSEAEMEKAFTEFMFS